MVKLKKEIVRLNKIVKIISFLNLNFKKKVDPSDSIINITESLIERFIKEKEKEQEEGVYFREREREKV
jgi:hypothetical protein